MKEKLFFKDNTIPWINLDTKDVDFCQKLIKMPNFEIFPQSLFYKDNLKNIVEGHQEIIDIYLFKRIDSMEKSEKFNWGSILVKRENNTRGIVFFYDSNTCNKDKFREVINNTIEKVNNVLSLLNNNNNKIKLINEKRFL